jgi:hypothetical protein
MIATLVLLLAALAPPEPLSAEQITQVRELVARTQKEQTAAKVALAEAQADLARHYADYELDEEAVDKLQREIIAAQRRLLENHHAMQKELRTIVGAERFQILSRRIENALREEKK